MPAPWVIKLIAYITRRRIRKPNVKLEQNQIGNLKNYATSYETIVYKGLSAGQIKVCCMRKGYNVAGFHCIFPCLLYR